MLVAISSKTRSNEEIVDHMSDVFDAGEKTYVICVTVSIELTSDNVGISVSKSIESHRPIVKSTFR